MSLLLGTFETCRRKLRMSAYRRRPKVTGARSIGVLTRRSRKQKALARDRGSRPTGPRRSTVPPLVQGFEVRQDRAGPRAQRWLMWPNTKQTDQNCPFGARSKKRKTVHRVLAPDQPGCTGCLDCSGCDLVSTRSVYRSRSRSRPRFRRVSIDNVAISVTYKRRLSRAYA